MIPKTLTLLISEIKVDNSFYGMKFALKFIIILTFTLMSKKLVIIKVKQQSGTITIPKIITKQTDF